MDIKLTNGKLSLVNGDISLTDSYVDSVAQRIYVRLKTTYGKWFLNIDYGIDYFGKIFGKAVNKTKVDLHITNEIRKDVEVEQLVSYKSIVDSRTRKYSAEFKIKAKGISDVLTYRVITTSNGLALLTEQDKQIIT